jgi:hypothetical protein
MWKLSDSPAHLVPDPKGSAKILIPAYLRAAFCPAIAHQKKEQAPSRLVKEGH